MSEFTADDLEGLLQKASRAHKEGRLADAEAGYLDLLKIKPGWGEVLNALGTVFLDQGLPDRARQNFEKAAALDRPHFPACYNLGRLKQRENDHAGAIAIYRAMLKKRPNIGEVWNNLGVAYREIGARDEAVSCFRRAVAFAPSMAEAWNNLGVAQDELQLVENAENSYRRAIEIRPDYTPAHFNLGISLQKRGRFEEAGQHYENVLASKPDDEAARFMLQSIGKAVAPDAAPVAYVRGIFEQCAGNFEEILVRDLEYRTPELLFELVRPYLTEEMNILDLGCGTGLGARRYRPYAKYLVGVDVSPKMLERAAGKRIFDRLDVVDILQDWDFPEKFDLIYSADVFVYFGNLDRIIGSASLNLVCGGILAFSVENLEGGAGGYQLFPSGRYAHSLEYIERCLGFHSLQLADQARAILRKQSGNPVEGLLIVAKKRF